MEYFVNQPNVSIIDHMGDDYRIVYSATISSGKTINPEDKEEIERLVHMLLGKNHLSPFEHVLFTFKVDDCPIFVARQWMRYRTWSFVEKSMRRERDELGFFVSDTLRSKKLDSESESEYLERIKVHFSNSYNLYKELLDEDVPPELARIVLPVSLTTSFIATVDLRNLMHFLEERLSAYAQQEFREYAKAIYNLVYEYVPITMTLFKEYHGFSI